MGLKEYSDNDEAFKVVQSDRDPNREVYSLQFANELSLIMPIMNFQVKIIAETEEALEYAKRRLTVITGRKVII
jgi:rRNA maturation protein Rpf1